MLLVPRRRWVWHMGMRSDNETTNHATKLRGYNPKDGEQPKRLFSRLRSCSKVDESAYGAEPTNSLSTAAGGVNALS